MNLEERLPVIEVNDRSVRPLPVGALHALLKDAVIYLRRYQRLQEFIDGLTD